MSIATGDDADADIAVYLRERAYPDAFRLLLPRYRDRVFRLAYSLLRDWAQAEDAAQEAFLRIWQALPRFDGRSQLATWIYAIARNWCLSELRKRRPTVSIDPEDDDLDARIGAAAGAGTPVDDASDQFDVQRLLNQLPERYAQMVTLFYLEDQSHEQTAAALGIPVGTVKATLHRARLKLAELAQVRRAKVVGSIDP